MKENIWENLLRIFLGELESFIIEGFCRMNLKLYNKVTDNFEFQTIFWIDDNKVLTFSCFHKTRVLSWWCFIFHKKTLWKRRMFHAPVISDAFSSFNGKFSLFRVKHLSFFNVDSFIHYTLQRTLNVDVIFHSLMMKRSFKEEKNDKGMGLDLF